MSRFTPKAVWLVGGFAALTISACILRKLISALVTARFDAPLSNTRLHIGSQV